MEKEVNKFSEKDFEGYKDLVNFTEKFLIKVLQIYQIKLQ